jgi:hypothetical protein
MIDVVRIAADGLGGFGGIVDPPGDLVDGVDLRDASHQTALAD